MISSCSQIPKMMLRLLIFSIQSVSPLTAIVANFVCVASFMYPQRSSPTESPSNGSRIYLIEYDYFFYFFLTHYFELFNQDTVKKPKRFFRKHTLCVFGCGFDYPSCKLHSFLTKRSL